ncbi:MAG: hypothetical protein CM1200mP20_09900 [Pseudomonadota bacterium]|nr:MAG: hypothetical protein CM1200mP20_09900 [Pseudomonadota bacterium]
MALVEVNNLAVQFGGIRAVDGVTFRISPGEIYTIIGPNGAGKTTIFNLISRIYDPTKGKRSIQWGDITRKTPPHCATGYRPDLSEYRAFENATVLETCCSAATGIAGRSSGRNRLPPCRSKAGAGAARKGEEVIDFLDLSTTGPFCS